jgi:general nucleoside transport system ATP-binding protein
MAISAQKPSEADAAPPASDVILRVRNVSKAFGSLVANDNVSFELRSGEVLALLGENGAGKTTLMNILFGHYVPDQGEIEAFGKALVHGSPGAAIAAGIGMVHQHFALADNLSVLDNVILEKTPLWRPFLRRAAARSELLRVMARSGLKVDPDKLIRELSVGERQRVEILKALFRGARILILDEPTAVLTPQEAEQLFGVIRELLADGLSVIFISHKLKEVTAISHRVIVLRAGRSVFEEVTHRTDHAELAQQMVGRDIPSQTSIRLTPGELILQLTEVGVQGEHGPAQLKKASLQLHRHEILGIAGVSGNGQQTLFNVICGLTPFTSGQVILLGQPVAGKRPIDIVQLGVARIPEDRHGVGVIADMQIWENLISERYREPGFQTAGLLRLGAARAHAESIITEFDIRCPSASGVTRLLSGGNMQKLILGRTLSRAPDVILANQPTRGLDVGAVSFVHERLIRAKQRGAGVLLISEDLDELLSLSDRLVVMFTGTVSNPIPRQEATTERLGLMMMGQQELIRHAV